jgi:hypothetical protein
MERRKFVKSVGTIVGASAVFSNTSAASTDSGGLGAYERYCERLLDNHGRIRRRDSAVSTRESGEIQTFSSGATGPAFDEETTSAPRDDFQTSGDTLETQDLSPLFDESRALHAVEGTRFTDGTVVTQTVTSEDGSIITVEMGDHRFKMRRDTVRRVLERRLGQAEQELQRHSYHDPLRPPGGGGSGVMYFSFDDWSTKEINVPLTGDTYNSADGDTCESASTAAVAGYASGKAKAYSTHSWDSSSELVAEFKGDYNAAAWNVLGTSEIVLKFKIESGGDKIGETTTLQEGTFLGDLWQDVSDYSENIYVQNPPGSFKITMKAKTKAVAIGTSQTGVSVATGDMGHHEGHFGLDSYELRET